MAGLSLYTSAVLNERVSFEAVVQEQSHDEGWFASIRIEDGKRGGTTVSLIARDPEVLAKLAEAALRARDELTAAMAVDDIADASVGQPAGPPF